MRTFLLLLGKSINKSRGCIAGICGEHSSGIKHRLDSQGTSDQRGTELGTWHMRAAETALHLESEHLGSGQALDLVCFYLIFPDFIPLLVK